jgi:hypothetical protein
MPGPSLPRPASLQAEAVAPSRRPVRFPLSLPSAGAQCIVVQRNGTRDKNRHGEEQQRDLQKKLLDCDKVMGPVNRSHRTELRIRSLAS